MTTYTHNPNNHLSRKASISATAPYTIPQKVKDHTNSGQGTPFSLPSNVHIPQHQHRPNENTHTSNGGGTPQPQRSINNGQQQPISSSVPVLSREFVVRRISEGETGRLKEELKCEACGKGYKHISSLAKHLWEHTPEWNVTKKLLISKHQQVQLLEAASILVSMNDSPEDETQQQMTNGLVFKNGEADHNHVKFNSKYQETLSPQPILEEDEDEDDEDDDDDDEAEMNIKSRTGSISQYPPSFNSTQNHLNSQRYPASRHGPINGGFLDTPTKHENRLKNTINGVLSADEQKEGDSEKESIDASSPRDEEDDGTVFGQMD